MTTRRSFLARAGLTAAAAALPGSTGRAYAANETVGVGVIGCGGRARGLMQSLVKIPGVRVVALADVWDNALSDAGRIAPAAAATKDYAELLARKDVDAVLIGTPDHQHVPCTVAALKAKKDVYVEKPLTHDPAEGPVILAAAAAAPGRVVQVGTQQRSMPHIRKAKELVKAGAIGRPVKVTMSWNRNTDRVRRFPLGVDPKSVDWGAFLGPARGQPFDEYRFRNWRWFWDFGGGIFTDLMVHWVDAAHWVLGMSGPTEAVALGAFTTAAGVWETPDTVQCVLSYPGGVQMHFEGTFSNARRGAGLTVMGTDASIYVDRGRLELTPERGRKVQAVSEVLGKGPPGQDFYDKPDADFLHVEDWVTCVRTRKPPAAGVQAGVDGAAAAHLANRALRSGGAAKA